MTSRKFVRNACWTSFRKSSLFRSFVDGSVVPFSRAIDGRIRKMNRRRVFCQNPTRNSPKNRFETKTSKRKETSLDRFHSLFLSRTGFVLDPQTYVYHYWLGIISFAVAYNLVLIPARYSFDVLDSHLRVLWLSLDYTFDFLYLVDIFIRSRTGYFSHGLFVRNHRVLSRKYFQSRQFFVRDVLSILPLDVFYIIPRFRFVPILRCNRFLRIQRLLEFQDLTESRTRFPNAFRIFCLICLTLILIHW